MQTRHPFLTAVSIMGRIPRTPLISPLSPSSPAIQTPFSLFVSRYPKAPRRAAAMGRSNLVPSLRMSAGERFTVILFGGKDSPVFLRAVHTRSWASRTLDERYPTIENTGRPLLTSASTNTGTPSTPEIVADKTLLYIVPPFQGDVVPHEGSRTFCAEVFCPLLDCIFSVSDFGKFFGRTAGF